MALRCAAGGGGGGAYLTPPRSRCCGAGAARPAATTTRIQGLSALLKVRYSPCSKVPRVLRCSTDSPPPRDDQNLVRNDGRNDAWDALKAMVADMFRPLARNLSDIRSLRSVYDLEDYQIGMLFGSFLGCVGCYQLWKVAPSVFVDAALAYGFYKLSVVSSELRRQGKCNDIITRLKFGIVAIMAAKDFTKSYELLDIVKLPVFFLYLSTFIFDMGGMKQYAKHYLIFTINLLRMKGGFQELLRMMFYPNYISPYDDCFRRK
ncbi:uncharacterized protein LOC124657227 [Lolium rigidum]|uniref:uncharacterized protein LOC124657227 n=1 Tax=Lolium rigidum TaxID=89674 RepID=UPI001F5C916C|nr:uncharacterized protein LOC124657227 [Lolium rigidum]